MLSGEQLGLDDTALYRLKEKATKMSCPQSLPIRSQDLDEPIIDNTENIETDNCVITYYFPSDNLFTHKEILLMCRIFDLYRASLIGQNDLQCYGHSFYKFFNTVPKFLFFLKKYFIAWKLNVTNGASTVSKNRLAVTVVHNFTPTSILMKL
ncbi:hypothetical protein C1645_549676 [Glomus cerebriforme]|uniref:Uncharacterized protein n=1 Tax=Glomus cerebriforme TaxID=658196 RepID=A0A397THZ1_9GLOM|nr:hypothetical protein C1645_549676 [Glomus cerebriforme]